mmetsp:Transcript_4091/g.5880  ORF Transcript_4091/g.5880 Transcript_4091/m.5880 type:complete len:211 (-) Transcript_4091:664-1296(-)
MFPSADAVKLPAGPIIVLSRWINYFQAAVYLKSLLDIFLVHGGLQYLPTSHLLSTGLINRTFKDHSRRDFNKRLRKQHPALAAASKKSTWKDWRRFELNEAESKSTGEQWQVVAEDIDSDIDVLIEFINTIDGNVVWHGCSPFRRIEGACPKCKLTLPDISFSVPKPREVEGGLIQQKSIFRAIDTPVWSCVGAALVRWSQSSIIEAQIK